ncbi:AMP-binding protein [Solimonas terrae]|uniref:Long-chain-fatty-acid--CoA ligase n=1 Tax=Solimonas terrae TaxID=1396819 RepID=A0A6M2BMA5_9GAMM|nr:AMP-binding protein [Solimonas terrae]NGY03812.1 AMP-binding protein [Solimonas terrae]
MSSGARAAASPRATPGIDAPRHASLDELLVEACREHAGNVALTQGDAQLRYAQLDTLSERLAAFLAGDLSLAQGERVALMMPNVLAYPLAICGVLRAGCVIVNVNPLYTARELRHQLCDSGARAIIVAEPFVPTVRSVLDDTSVDTVIVVPVARVPAAGHDQYDHSGTATLDTALASRSELPPRTQRHGDTAILQYTGGTTGPSKGAELTHGNLLANLDQLGAWFGDAMRPGREVVITALPLYHIFALTVNLLSFLRLGGRNVLIGNPRDLPALVQTMRREGFSVITGVNTLYNGLLNTPTFASLDFSGLKLSMGGGSAVQPAVARQWQSVTGKVLLEGYGLSETSPVLTVNRIDSVAFRAGIGLPLPGTEISIRDDDGREVAPGESGELCARGPQVMRGYWDKPDENAAAFTEDGFFRTGDMARRDEDGHYHIVDRKKDMVLVSGFNVYPNEIEAVCAEHAGVLESACIGVPDARTGEALKLFVVRRDPALSEDVLIEHCRRNLTAYKVPRQVQFLSELPKSPVGKILRRELRA